MNRTKVEEMLNKAFQLGKRYEFQAEHEFISYNKKSDDTLAEFKALLTSLLAEDEGYENSDEHNIRQALARGYCTDRNAGKTLDSDLIEDMVTEVLQLSNAEDEGEGWISVEERLPEKMQDILFTVVGVKDMNNEPIPPSVHYGWLDLANGFRSYIDPRDRWLATHWMPLPKAPSQPQKGERE